MCISKEDFFLKKNLELQMLLKKKLLRERNTLTKQQLISSSLMTEKANPALVPFMENGS